MSFGDFAIAPSTTVTLCAGVPLAKGSEDTFIFSTAGEQASKISSYQIATFSNLTYQRNTRNVVRVGMPMGVSGANSALRANYLIFNNSAFEGKNIYAFVDSIDYVNNNTIDVTFTIDAMQTFMFDFSLNQCYVEREHALIDDFGGNVVPEEFGALGAVVNEADDYFQFKATSPNHKYACVIYNIANRGVRQDPQTLDWIEDPASYSVAGRYANNVYVGAGAAIKTAGTAASGIDAEIEGIMHAGGTIVSVQMIPPAIITAADNGTGLVSTKTYPLNSSFTEGSVTFTPRNKKLLTYPFNYLTVSNNAGEERQYRWEYFSPNNLGGRSANFAMYGAYQPSPECALVPSNYKNMAVNYAECVLFNAFPSSAWSEDSFLNWQLRNGNSTNASITGNKIGTVSSMVSSALAGAAIGSAAGPAGMIAGAGVGLMAPAITGGINQSKIEAQVKDAQATPDKLNGNAASNSVNEMLDCTGFTVFYMHIPIALAQTIDDYFTMYGYAMHRVKQPNINSRPRFNYVKTRGCTIYGSVPAEFAKEIQERFNSGVRFWKSGATIGDYTTANEP